jgi:hypothetical protein
VKVSSVHATFARSIADHGSEVVALHQIGVRVHRRSATDSVLFPLLWEVGISAAATINVDSAHLIACSYLVRLRWAIEEDSSRVVASRGRRLWALNLCGWKSLSLARKDRSVFPTPLVQTLGLCLSVRSEWMDCDSVSLMDSDWDTLLYAMDEHMSTYVM